MPIEYHICVALDLCYARWWGSVTLEDARLNFETYLEDPQYRPGRRELIDIRELSGPGMAPADILHLLDRINDQAFPNGHGTQMVVLAGSDLSYGLARRFEGHASLRDGVRSCTVRDERAALDAFGLEFQSIRAMLESQ